MDGKGWWKMRGFSYTLFTLLFSISCVSMAGAADAGAIEAVVMPSSGDACKSTRMDAEHAAEESEWRCAGPNGFSLRYNDVTTRGGITIAYRGRDVTANDLIDDDLNWAPGRSGIASRMEWRLRDGMPVAAIIGRWRRPEEANGSTDADVEELLIVKVTPASACAVAVIGGLQPQAMAAARDIADRKATGFRCGVDHPSIASSLVSDAVKTLDHHFSNVEFLDHNGSIVELDRSADGAIDIRYREPKATIAIAIEPGTLLFHGSEHDGEIKGEAFVFKTGCPPAGYQVSGRRLDGLLSLEGAAPRRGAGCALLGLLKSSKHSYLAFEHEPVLNTATVEAAAAPTDSLPIERGYYVRSDSPCQRASNATLTLYTGTSFGTAHAECRAPVVEKLADGSHRITEQCRDTEVDGTPWIPFTARYAVTSRTEFVSKTEFEMAAYRYCKQTDLPEPWRNVDLRAVGVR
jgi:hypothetical protein